MERMVEEPVAYWLGGCDSSMPTGQELLNQAADGTFSVVIRVVACCSSDSDAWSCICRFCCLLLSLGIVRDVRFPARSSSSVISIDGIRTRSEAVAIGKAMMSYSPLTDLTRLIGNLEACEQVKLLTVAA